MVKLFFVASQELPSFEALGVTVTHKVINGRILSCYFQSAWLFGSLEWVATDMRPFQIDDRAKKSLASVSVTLEQKAMSHKIKCQINGGKPFTVLTSVQRWTRHQLGCWWYIPVQTVECRITQRGGSCKLYCLRNLAICVLTKPKASKLKL